MQNLLRGLLALTLTAPLLLGCATTTRLTSAWRDPSYNQRPARILVIGVAKRPANKRIFEDELVRQLQARGTEAVASYTVMPDSSQGDRAVISLKLAEVGADAVLISRLASKRTVQVYVPGGVSFPPAYYGSWRDYYGFGFQSVVTPGYMAEDEFALMEINLYDAKTDRLVWSATSETELMGSDAGAIRSYIGVMVGALADARLVQ